MKKLLLLLFIPSLALANQFIYKRIYGEVIVLETPVFSEPNDEAYILDWIRKGDEIYLRRKGLSHDPNSRYFTKDKLRGVNPQPFHLVPNNGYHETVTRNGISGFVKSDHIKIIYNDSREFLTKVKRWDHDPTDYRLEEPLPEEYPLFDPRKFRTIISYSFGPQRKINYPYPSKIIGEDFGERKGGNFFYMKKVDFDPYNRFYFGAGVTIFQANSRFDLLNGAFAVEENLQFSIGPYFSYDAYRISRIVLTFAGGIGINYYRTAIAVQGTGNSVEERNFSSINFSPRLGSYISIKDLLPFSDLMFGAELQATHPFSMTSTQEMTNTDAFNENNDQIPYELGAQFSIFIGFISKY